MAEDPQVTPRDQACAVFARAALFPWKVDWSKKHHSIHPALQALDLIREDELKKNGRVSTLFPRGVAVVGSTSNEKKVQWNGQPIIKESSVEIIPNVLTVKCMECDAGNKDNKTTTKTAFTRSKVVEERGDTQLCHEIVLCTNRLLKKDYAKSKDPTLLEQRKDLPPQSLAAVEEALTREIIKIREQSRQVKSDNNNDDSIPNKKKECEKFAAIEIEAARRAECFYEKKGSEVRKGSCLKPIGFSWLPKALQQNLLNRCVKATATKMTCREFGKKEGTQCVARVMENTTLNDDNKQQ